MEKAKNNWYQVKNIGEVASPAVLVYPERIEENIRRMISVAGSVERLRPHVKTHKMPELIRMQLNYGISKFKTSTIAETEMVAKCGAKDILLAMQPVGPNLARFFHLRKNFPDAEIACLADNEEDISLISQAASETGIETAVWLDINVGMNRTGIVPGKKAAELWLKIKNSSKLKNGGLHVYDGHIHEHDLKLREKLCSEAFAPVITLIDTLKKEGANNIRIVAGGTPSFPVHARHGRAELSPGTLLLWDYGYSQGFSDMDFLHAAVLLTRIVSKPGEDLLCLDLGHKAVASEMPHPRVKILGLEEYTFTGHNEEHLVIKTPEAPKFKTGDVLYCIPWHICPTMDRHDMATVVKDNEAVGQWAIEARKRKLTY
jgi:D-serine deaminase-like pyridoxal phosphate-dependent protein